MRKYVLSKSKIKGLSLHLDIVSLIQVMINIHF